MVTNYPSYSKNGRLPFSILSERWRLCFRTSRFLRISAQFQARLKLHCRASLRKEAYSNKYALSRKQHKHPGIHRDVSTARSALTHRSGDCYSAGLYTVGLDHMNLQEHHTSHVLARMVQIYLYDGREAAVMTSTDSWKS